MTGSQLSRLITHVVFCLSDEDIDEKAFLLINEDAIKNLVLKVGPRLKFLRLFGEFISSLH